MNNKNVFLLLLCLGMSLASIGCGRRTVCEVEEKRCSGPLSDCDTKWSEGDYK